MPARPTQSIALGAVNRTNSKVNTIPSHWEQERESAAVSLGTGALVDLAESFWPNAELSNIYSGNLACGGRANNYKNVRKTNN